MMPFSIFYSSATFEINMCVMCHGKCQGTKKRFRTRREETLKAGNMCIVKVLILITMYLDRPTTLSCFPHREEIGHL